MILIKAFFFSLVDLLYFYHRIDGGMQVGELAGIAVGATVLLNILISG